MGTESHLEALEQLSGATTGHAREDASVSHAPMLASRVVQDGRPSALDQASVVHLQASAGNASVAGFLAEDAPDQVRSVLGSGGERLDQTVAADMSARLGADVSNVRIHRDTAASESAHAVHANAYTVGDDIVFRAGHFDPGSPAGQQTLAHELTHVIQQRSGAVDGTEMGGGLAVSDPSDRFEREAAANAAHVMAAEAPSPGPATTVARSADETELQRDAGTDDDEDDDLQRHMAADEADDLQRDAAEEEDEEAGDLQRDAESTEDEDEEALG